jgi:hypothetical protein
MTGGSPRWQPTASPIRGIAEALVVTQRTRRDASHARYAKLDLVGRKFLAGVLT